MHGANRLASNSLLEAAAFGRRAGRAAADHAFGADEGAPGRIAIDLPEAEMTQLRAAMTAHAGPVRDAAGLTTLIALIDRLQAQQPDAAVLTTARLAAEAALARRESRGGHWRADWPQTNDTAAHTRLTLNTRDKAA